MELSFTKYRSEYGVYVLAKEGDIIILYLYVDDLLITRNNINNMNKLKQLMPKEFEMSDLGDLSYF